MTRPARYTLALALLLIACIAALVAMRPSCNCTLGQHDSFDPADCPIHGEVTE